ncbi:hypothetical protein B4102_1977 [Heyndrickxia sporothermodurans]|uniref:Uncharacterized protein n=1 Tax=Heyndrickxia sporothermodurans TaxID=46224 RepID=A0A150L5Q6_9BACI|nr:hypothetical protein B4102_1977 [Heyndrickxia sporothermodurans]
MFFPNKGNNEGLRSLLAIVLKGEAYLKTRVVRNSGILT